MLESGGHPLQGSSSPLELESADPRSFLTSADVWSGAATGKEGRQGIEKSIPIQLVECQFG